jgi:hypothetical protein
LNFNGKFNTSQKKLAEQGQKALFGLNCNFRKLNKFDAETRSQLFDIYVENGSIISYGCEIWGFHQAPEIEQLNLLFCYFVEILLVLDVICVITWFIKN